MLEKDAFSQLSAMLNEGSSSPHRDTTTSDDAGRESPSPQNAEDAEDDEILKIFDDLVQKVRGSLASLHSDSRASCRATRRA